MGRRSLDQQSRTRHHTKRTESTKSIDSTETNTNRSHHVEGVKNAHQSPESNNRIDLREDVGRVLGRVTLARNPLEHEHVTHAQIAEKLRGTQDVLGFLKAIGSSARSITDLLSERMTVGPGEM
eukprot:6050966-Prymnesium_polylepis.1